MRAIRQRLLRATVALPLAAMVATAGSAWAADDLLTCRRAVGREGARLVRKAATILRKCHDRRLKTGMIVCPRASDVTKIDVAQERARSRITSACTTIVPPEFLGACPDPCAATTVADAESLAGCISCLADGATSSFIEQVFPEPPAICGDGIISGGEQCDAPDDAACPGRCGAPGALEACQCQPVESCFDVPQPPGSCSAPTDCPPGYACAGTQCVAGSCVVEADCPAGGHCVHIGSATEGQCVCRGCDPWSCRLGCTLGAVSTGCICISIDDCPDEDDVCFQGVCS